MISMVVPSGSEHENFTSYFRMNHNKVLFDDDDDLNLDTTGMTTTTRKVHDKNKSEHKSENVVDDDLVTVTYKNLDNMGFNSVVHVKGGPRSFSSSPSSASTSTSSSSCSSYQEILSINNFTNDEGRGVSNSRRESESYVAVKGQSLILTKLEGQKRGLCRRPSAVALLSGSPPQSKNSMMSSDGNPLSMDSPEEGNHTDSEFGYALSHGVLRVNGEQEIERHLHQMTQLLRPEDSIKLVVRLESVFCKEGRPPQSTPETLTKQPQPGRSRIRYLAVVSCMERQHQDQETEEFCLLGIDCQGGISLGLVLAILSHTVIRLDGDGGFCVTYGDGLRSHIFKPVSVQTMWSALQSLYRASECAKKNNSFQVSAVRYYDGLFQSNKSDAGCLSEWNLLPGVETKRPLLSNMSLDELSFQEKISTSLREILLSERDLDEVTSKEIRTKLEHKLHVDLSNYKPFIDEEMLKILGQMEAPAMILENLYLGTEWNASHQQDLFDKDIGYILNVTAEIDNFFPDTFRYMNIPVNDNEETDLLRYFNDSYRFINEAHKKGKNVLVHCKMGISRSATIVIAYVMKNRNWDLQQSIEHVQDRRQCVKPNPNFMKQLEVYQGILIAKRFSDTLEKRSKSESNLKQSDFSLASPKDTNISSSNGHLSHSNLKSPKKYYNTAPARLKGDEERSFSSMLKNKSTLSRPKSSSCAAISTSRVELTDDIFGRDVLDSFQAAVQHLKQSNPPCSLQNKLEFKQPGERSSLPNITDYWLRPFPVPIVTVVPDNLDDRTCNYVSKETLVLNQAGLQGEMKEAQLSEPSMAEVDSNKSEIDVDGGTTSFLKVPTSPSDEPDSSVPSSDQARKRTNTILKCCRRPFNGHTFSVSPNQVVNISSISDYSNFSVRHLVNEFEVYSNRRKNVTVTTNNSTATNTATTTTASESSGCHPSAIADVSVSSPVIRRNNNNSRKKSWDPHEPFEDPILDTSISILCEDRDTSEFSEQESSVIAPVTDNAVIPSYSACEQPEQEQQQSQNEEILEFKKEKVGKKIVPVVSNESKIGCLPFSRRTTCGSMHHNRNDRSAKEAASNTIVRLLKTHTKRATEPSRSREKFKDRGSRIRSSKHSSVVPPPPVPPSHHHHQIVKGDNCVVDKGKLVDVVDPANSQSVGSATIPTSAGLFKSTGVVKQRLEAFEAKSVQVKPVPEQQQYNNRSHNRSHSATAPLPSSALLFSKETSLEKFSLGHRRKSSMPHLNHWSNKGQSNPTLNNIASNCLFDRKGSLDSNTISNTLFRSMPNRPFTVRGFQPASNQSLSSNKIPYSSTRHQKSNFNLSSGVRQQHGNTHPLKLLPQTTKLSQ